MRVLEISRVGLFKSLSPAGTDWIRWGAPLTAVEPHSSQSVALAAVAATLRRLRAGGYDLVVLPAIQPDHKAGQPRGKLVAKAMLDAASRWQAGAVWLSRLMLGSTRHIIVDISDDRHLCQPTMRLFPGHTLYFKRELDLDLGSWPQAPDRVRPLSLFLPDEHHRPSPHKDIDVFFAGALCNRVRTQALEAASALSNLGFRVVTPGTPLPYAEFMATAARSWLVLSPEGYGWDCYRHYEACLVGSVPVINRPSYRRHLYLEDLRHCFYYDAGADVLAERLRGFLTDKSRLLRMGAAGREHVLANHTRAAVASTMLSELGRVEPSLSREAEFASGTPVFAGAPAGGQRLNHTGRDHGR